MGNVAKNIYLEGVPRAGQIPIQTPTSCYNSFGDREGLVSRAPPQLFFYDMHAFIISEK